MRNIIGAVITTVFIATFAAIFALNPKNYTELFHSTIMDQLEDRGIEITDSDGQTYFLKPNKQHHFYVRETHMKSTYTVANKDYYVWHIRLSVWESREKNITLSGIVRYYRDEEDPRMFVLDQWIPLKLLQIKGVW